MTRSRIDLMDLDPILASGVVSGAVLSYQFGTNLEPVLGPDRADDRLRGSDRLRRTAAVGARM